MNVTASSSASIRPCADSCISSTSPAKPTWKVAGIELASRTFWMSAVTSPRARPCRSTPILACRTRCSRSIELGPTPGSIRTRSPVRTTAPPWAWIGAAASAMKSLRNSGARRTRMSNSWSSSRSLLGTSPSTMLRTCVATDPTLKPRSAARARSTCATSSGWPDTSVVPTSTAPGIARILRDQLVTQALQLLHVVAAHVQVDGRLVGRALHELGIGDLDLGKRDRLEARPQIRLDVLELDAPLVLPRGLHPELRLAHLAAGAHRGEHLPDFRRVEKRALDFRHALHGFVERHARRQVHHHDELAAVLIRHELGADERQRGETGHEHEERGRHHLDRMRQRPAQHLEVLAIEPVVGLAPALEQPAHPRADALFGRHVAHEPRRQHRIERERDHQRHGDGKRHGERE